jgi:hypothetical protein
VTLAEGPFRGGSHSVELRLEITERFDASIVRARRDRLRQRREMLGVCTPQSLQLAGFDQPRTRVRTERIKEDVARRCLTDLDVQQRLVDQRGKLFQDCTFVGAVAANRGARRERERSGKDPESGEEAAFVLAEQLVAPVVASMVR